MEIKSEKTAFITGASRGIGRSTALALAEDGFDIWLNYKNSEEQALAVKNQIEAMGKRCRLLPFDVADGEKVHAILTPLLQKTVPDVLVNNAGLARDTVFGLMSDEDWQSVLDVNLNGFFHVTREIVPHMMRRRSGRIVNITSLSGQAGNAGQTNYSAAKAGIIGATKSLARELGKRGILVNAVAPGLIETDMTGSLPLKEYLKAVPLNRIGKPEDVAGCVRFLCSEWASYVTGQVIAVNGGLYM